MIAIQQTASELRVPSRGPATRFQEPTPPGDTFQAVDKEVVLRVTPSKLHSQEFHEQLAELSTRGIAVQIDLVPEGTPSNVEGAPQPDSPPRLKSPDPLPTRSAPKSQPELKITPRLLTKAALVAAGVGATAGLVAAQAPVTLTSALHLAAFCSPLAVGIGMIAALKSALGPNPSKRKSLVDAMGATLGSAAITAAAAIGLHAGLYWVASQFPTAPLVAGSVAGGVMGAVACLGLFQSARREIPT